MSQLQKYTCDEDRCESPHPKHGTCTYKKVEGTPYCQIHGGSNIKYHQDKREKRNYNLMMFQHEINDKMDASNLTSLHEEICLLRMMIEKHINACTTNTDLLLKSHVISDLVMKVQQTAKTLSHLENVFGNLLDKRMQHKFATTIVEIVSKTLKEVIDDDNLCESVISDICDQVLAIDI